MSMRSRQFYTPYGDRGLVGVNTFLRTIQREQIQSFQVLPRGRGTNVHLTYEDKVIPRLEAASPPDNSWMRVGYYPANMDLFFNEPLDSGQFEDGTFKWILLGSVVDVLAGTLSISEEERVVSVPFPAASLTSYTGTATLVADGISSAAGATARDRIQVGVHITDGHIPRTGQAPSATSQAKGRMRMSRLFGSGVKLQGLISDFVRRRQIEQNEIIDIVYNAGQVTKASEAFILWYQTIHPRILSVSPQPGSNVAKEYTSNQVTIAFSEGVAEYYLKGLDGEDRVYWNGSPFGGTYTQEDDIGSIWTLSQNGLFQNEGVYTLFLRDLRNLDGDSSDLLAQYSWVVTPVEVSAGTGATTSACERESFAPDGVETTFTLTYTPLSDCDVDPYLNGLQCDPSGWYVSGNDVIFYDPPFDGAALWVKYTRSADSGPGFDSGFSSGFEV